MSYNILKSNGESLIQLKDGEINQTTTDLTLIGKNVASYGTFYNENLVRLLENFSNSQSPSNPITGQLWFDTSQGRLKVYDGNLFRVSGGAIVSRTIPAQLATGDLWIDSKNQQMYFNDGTANVLAGPIYTQTQGLSGFQTGTVTDTVSIDHTVLYLYLQKTLVGIFALEEFTPRLPITGFLGTIKVGFNSGSVSGLKFNVPATSASILLAADGTNKTAENFLNTGDSSLKMTTTNQLIVSNEEPLVLGAAQNTTITVDAYNFSLNSKIPGQDFIVAVNSSGNANGETSPALVVSSLAQRFGVFVSSPTETLDVNGNARIRGNVRIGGTSVIIETPITPTTAYSAGTPGQMLWDKEYMYFYVGKSVDFTGYIDGTTLYITDMPVGKSIEVGMYINQTETITAGIKITAFDTGTGGVGSYDLSASETAGTDLLPIAISATHHWKRVALTTF
jgi:hypothetical protein